MPRAGLVVARVAGGVALLAGTYLVLRPFLVPMAWAAIVTYVSWPLYHRARRRIGHPHVTAALFTAVAFIGLGLPAGWFVIALADQGVNLVQGVQAWLEAGAPLPGWLTSNAWIGPRIEELRSEIIPGASDLMPYLAGIAGQASNQLVKLASGVAHNVFVFATTLLALYAFLVDGERLLGHARRLARAIFPNAPAAFLEDVGNLVRAVVFGLLGTAIVQGVVMAIGCAIFAVPSPVALGALTVVMSFVPGGPVMVWGGATAWLYLSDQTGAAIGMALWGFFLVSSVDNVLRPILISRSGAMRIPFLLIFFGVLGGLAAFGLLGLFLGPVLLSVTFALIAEFPPRDSAAPAPVVAPEGPRAAP
jgi:predicted PurR-regulated permease PerM